MATFNESDFITTKSGIMISSNFLIFSSKLLSVLYVDESYLMVSTIEYIVSNNQNIQDSVLEYLHRLESIDIAENGYLLINKGKNKIRFGKFLKKIISLRVAKNLMKKDIDAKNIEKIVDLYKSWHLANAEQKLKFVEYFGDDVSDGYHLNNYYRKCCNMLANSCMNDCYDFLEIYRKNPTKVSVLALVDNNNKIHGRALLWKLDNGDTFLDRIYAIDNFLTCVFQDHAMKNEWIIRDQHSIDHNSVLICKIDKGTKKYKPVDGSDARLVVSLDTKGIKKYPYMDTFFFKSIWSNKFTTSKHKFIYYKYHSTRGKRTKYINLFGLKMTL